MIRLLRNESGSFAAAAGALASLLFVLAVPAAAQDRVILLDGDTVPCKIESAGLEEIRAEVLGSTRTFNSRNVLEIEFGGAPESLQRAEEFLAAQDFQNAVNLFQSAVVGEGPSWLAAWAGLRNAEALLLWARVDRSRAGEAADAFRTWTATYPDHFHSVRARTGLASAEAFAGKIDDAARQLEELATFAFEKNLGKHVELGARLARSEVYLLGEQHAVAESRLNSLLPEIQEAAASADTPPALRGRLRGLLSRAQIVLGDAKVGKNGAVAARPYWETLTRDRGASTEVRAAAYVGLGLAARAEGKTRDAQLLLARVVATIPAQGEVMARALFHLGEVCKDLEDQPAASTDYFNRVVSDYPGTTWAILARQKLDS